MSRRLVTSNAMRGLLYREAVRRRAARLPYAPFTIYLDPCNACDVRCTFCPQSNWGRRARGQMPWELFTRAVDEIVRLKPARVFLFCYGEATLNKRIADMVRTIADAGLRIRMHTNAFALTEGKARALVEAGLHEVKFSFDTADRELYNRMRQGSDFEKVLANIRRMVEIRDELGADRPAFYLQELVPFAEGAGKPANTRAYMDLFAGLKVKFRAKYMHSFAGQGGEAEFAMADDEGASHCSQLYRRIVVNFDGKIHACCLDPEGHNIVGDLAAGDSIAESWNGPAMIALRERTNRGDVAGVPPCDKCELLRRAAPSPMSWPRRALAAALWRVLA